jgi:hypothetical protein
MTHRIQLSRAKGWRMPENTVKVDRSTKWGNPFPIGKEGPYGRTAPDAEGAVGFFTDMLRDREIRAAADYPTDLSPLEGKNLACWCKLGTPCHADVLLKAADRTAWLAAEFADIRRELEWKRNLRIVAVT